MNDGLGRGEVVDVSAVVDSEPMEDVGDGSVLLRWTAGGPVGACRREQRPASFFRSGLHTLGEVSWNSGSAVPRGMSGETFIFSPGPRSPQPGELAT